MHAVGGEACSAAAAEASESLYHQRPLTPLAILPAGPYPFQAELEMAEKQQVVAAAASAAQSATAAAAASRRQQQQQQLGGVVLALLARVAAAFQAVRRFVLVLVDTVLGRGGSGSSGASSAGAY